MRSDPKAPMIGRRRGSGSKITRYAFLGLAGIGAGGLVLGACGNTGKSYSWRGRGGDVRAARYGLDVGPFDFGLGGRRVSSWGYDGQIPGPEIRLKRGDTVRAEVRNRRHGEYEGHGPSRRDGGHGRQSPAPVRWPSVQLSCASMSSGERGVCARPRPRQIGPAFCNDVFGPNAPAESHLGAKVHNDVSSPAKGLDRYVLCKRPVSSASLHPVEVCGS